MAVNWTRAMDQVLRNGWMVGLSDRLIAGQLCGVVTKSAVAGRRRRLKDLTPRPAQVLRETLVLSNQTRRTHFPLGQTIPEAKVEVPGNSRAAFEPLPKTEPRPWVTRAVGECAWPVGGQGAGMLSCCAPVAEIAPAPPYCKRHRRLRQGAWTAPVRV